MQGVMVDGHQFDGICVSSSLYNVTVRDFFQVPWILPLYHRFFASFDEERSNPIQSQR
jgi:hypothetical protein